MNTPRTKGIVRFPASIKRPKPARSKPGTAVRYSGVIQDHAFAEALGHIVSQWAHLEESMVDILGMLVGDGGRNAQKLIFRSVNSTAARIQIMRSLLEESPGNRHRGQEFDEIIAEFASLTAERNAYVHGLWWTDDKGRIYRDDPSDTRVITSIWNATPISFKQAMHVLNRIGTLQKRVSHLQIAEIDRIAALAKSPAPSASG